MTATTTGRAAVVTVSTRRTGRRAITPLLIGLFATALSLVAISVPSVWYDEAATIGSATRTWPQLLAEVSNVDAVHALYYAFMHVVFDVFGYSPLTLRVPSAIAIGITAAFVVVLGRQLGRERLAIIAGLVFALLPRVTWAGAEGRSYAATTTVAVLLTVVLVHALRQRRRRWWALYAALIVVSCVLFIYVALIVVAHAVTIVILAATSPERRPWAWRTAAWRPWFIAAATGGLLLLPFAVVSLNQKSQINWIHALDATSITEVLVEQWFYTSLPFAVVGWAGIVAGLIVAFRSRFRDQRAGILIPLVLLPTILLIAASAVTSPIYTPRYLSMCLPFVALAIAVAIDAVKWRFAAVVGVALIALLAVPQVIAQRQPEAKEFSSWSSVASFIAAERAADGADSTTAVVYGTVQRHPKASARVIAYSYPDAFAGTIDVTLDTPAAETGELWETRMPIAASTDRLVGADTVYLVTSKSRDQRPETTRVLAADGWVLDEETSFTSVWVLRYVRA